MHCMATAIRFGVDENYRVTFRFDGGHAYEVDYEDHH